MRKFYLSKKAVPSQRFPSDSNQISASALPRIFVHPENINKTNILLKGEPLKKVSRVLRLKTQDELCVFDGTGAEYLTQIISLTAEQGELKILAKKHPLRESPLEIHLGQAVPKANKMDLIVQKAVELGVFEVHPFLSDRTIPDYDQGQTKRRVQRWQKISQEAARQSGRAQIPKVNIPVGFKYLLKLPPEKSFKFILQKDFSNNLEKNSFKNQEKSCIFFLVGPEGGFTPEEINLARDEGFEPLSLGPRILRTETVALAFLSILQYKKGDIII